MNEFLDGLGNDFSFQKPLAIPDQEKPNSYTESKINIVQEKSLNTLSLIRYLQQRRISLDLAVRYCREGKILIEQ